MAPDLGDSSTASFLRASSSAHVIPVDPTTILATGTRLRMSTGDFHMLSRNFMSIENSQLRVDILEHLHLKLLSPNM